MALMVSYILPESASFLRNFASVNLVKAFNSVLRLSLLIFINFVKVFSCMFFNSEKLPCRGVNY